MPSRPTDIDRLYGLEPVIDMSDGAGSDGLNPFADVACPYCGEFLSVQLDLSAGSQSYVEDCQVCCQPIQMAVRVAGDGTLDSLSADRLDR